MRTFYLFEVKPNIIRNYKYNYDELYSILENIQRNFNEDIIVCYNIFKSIVNPINKEELNNYIKKRNIGSENYICYNDTHSINDYYNDETTKMIINNSHIKINTNKNLPTFFNDIRQIKNIFVCDFEHHDYFLLEEALYTSCITV